MNGEKSTFTSFITFNELIKVQMKHSHLICYHRMYVYVLRYKIGRKSTYKRMSKLVECLERKINSNQISTFIIKFSAFCEMNDRKGKKELQRIFQIFSRSVCVLYVGVAFIILKPLYKMVLFGCESICGNT